MNKLLIFTTAFVLFVSFSIQAQVVQTLDLAYMKVAYHYSRTRKPPRPRPLTDELILAIGHKSSFFYSPLTFEIDTLNASNDGREKFFKQFNDSFSKGIILSKKYHTYVFKNYPEQGVITITDRIGTDTYIYEDKLHDQVWQIADSTKTILNYECQMATCHYRGRDWIVWFCSEIPVGNGPWLLGGLPGLILEAYDAEKLYHFTAIGMEKVVDAPIVIIKNPDLKGYIQTNRVEFLKAKRRYIVSPMASIEAQTGIKLGEDRPNTESYEPIEFFE
ncbi:GLPGLI family protein [Porphyromonas macacae]|uniref:GLPGLI family protein n=1 Tax=Porphyromonas macacae TaxID=28115 RepID=UPI00359FD561